jgi:hypothetical protein
VILLAAVVALGVALEVATRWGMPRFSQNQRRIRDEYQTALTLGQKEAAGQVPVLLLGNSLTHRAVDMPLLQARLGNKYRAARLAVDDTRYYDWYFGLRRLFREGARPRFVVVGARSYHLTASRVRGDYFARHLLHRGDLLEAAAQTHADPTRASDMFFANFSEFYGGREEVNKKALSAVLPGVSRLTALFVQERGRGGGEREKTASLPFPSPSPSLLSDRIRELKTLCEANGARLILWMPPHTEVDPRAAEVIAAGRDVGVDVVVPVRHNEIPAERFPDGEHLDAAGAAQLTAALAPQLRPLLAKPVSRLVSRGRE